MIKYVLHGHISSASKSDLHGQISKPRKLTYTVSFRGQFRSLRQVDFLGFSGKIAEDRKMPVVLICGLQLFLGFSAKMSCRRPLEMVLYGRISRVKFCLRGNISMMEIEVYTPSISKSPLHEAISRKSCICDFKVSKITKRSGTLFFAQKRKKRLKNNT